MSPLLFLVTLITSFKSVLSLKNEYISNRNYNPNIIHNYILRRTNEINDAKCDCLPSDFNNNANSNVNGFIICCLKCLKNGSIKFKDLVMFVKLYIILIDNREIDTSKFNKIENLTVNITRKIVNNDTMIDQISEILNKTNLTDLMIDFIHRIEKPQDITEKYICEFLNNLLNMEGFFELFQSLYNSLKTEFLDITGEILATFENDLTDIFNIIRTKMGEHIDDTIVFIFRLFKDYKNKDLVFNDIEKFIIEHNTSFNKIKEIMMEEKIINFLIQLIDVNNPIIINIKNSIFSNKKTLGLLLDILRNKKSLELVIKVLKNLDNTEILEETIGKLASSIIDANSTMLEPITKFLFDLIFNNTNNNESITIMHVSDFQKFIANFVNGLNSNFSFTEDCKELLNYTFFDIKTKNKSIFYFYFHKYLFDSSRNNGDFLSFDNCMYNSYNFSAPPKYNISPTYIIGIINEVDEKKKHKNSSFYFKFNFLKSYCFPFGYKNETSKAKKSPMCKESDYLNAFLLLNRFYKSKNFSNINIFSINESNIFPNALEKFYGVLGILLLGFPLLIYLFLLISGNIIAKKQIKKINEIDESNKNLKTKKNKLIEVNNKINIKKIIFPRWYQYLNECFNIRNNINKLFNFSFNSINYNNFKGMTYTKGTVGIFSILTVFGHVFISLINLPNKNYGIYNYYLMMSNPFYFILFIGYRYSPRILFSCSGYSLIYKYLCYIEQEPKLYFLKFVFLQSYKYLILIFSIIFIRFLLYYVVFLLVQIKRPVWEIFKYFIESEGNFIWRFFSFLVYFNEEDNSIRQNLIFFFYIPINEVLLFLFGTALISLGYKFKLRIDIIIIVIILLVYLLKILLFIITQNNENKMYTTTDYYLYDYGLNIMHPLFNLNYFLIGMFFGLINYSIQKGITDLEEKNNYQNIFLLTDYKSINDEDNHSILNQSTFSTKHNNIDIDELKVNKDNSALDILSNKSSNNNKLSKTFTSLNKKNKNNKDKRTKRKNDVDNESNVNFGKFIAEESELGSKKIEYSERIKEMPFLIWPIKFSNFHKTNKDKLILNLVIFIAFLLLLFLIDAQSIFTWAKIDTKKEGKDRIEELSFKKVIPQQALNIIFLLDIEVVIFAVQWINLIFYFKEIGIIKSFLNHVYWSFFVKIYFSFNIVSVTVIFCVFYINENVIKFNLSNIFLYTFIDLVFILIFTIAVYCCFELPFKKVFKIFLRGKDALSNERDDDEYDEEEEK